MSRPISAIVAILTSLPFAGHAAAEPPSRDEVAHQGAALERLRQSLVAEPAAAGKLAVIEKAMAAEPDPNIRRRVLALAGELPATERETLLTGVLAGDADAGLRGQAATELGKVGSQRALAALTAAAATDPTTQVMIGDIGGRSSARRSATFAIAELAARHPAIAADAAAKLRALKVADDPKDNEGLADARDQAMYQITRDDALLKPFRERLKSEIPRERERGVIAFRFLNLRVAPPQVTAELKDADPGVRTWAALVLGEIGDPKTADALMAIAGDAQESAGPRCNAIYSLGRMKAPAAAGLMEKLLADADPRIPASAAIALYRITGKKAPQFPAGYNAD